MGQQPIPDIEEVWASIERLRQEVTPFRSRLQEAADKVAVLDAAAHSEASRAE